MRDYKQTSSYKGLPNHNIQAHEQLDRIVVERWDDTAEMMVEIAIKWQQFAEWEMKSWPRTGTVRAVILRDGTRRLAKQFNVNFRNNPDAFNLSQLCRASSKITSNHGEVFYSLPDLLSFAETSKTAEKAEAILG